MGLLWLFFCLPGCKWLPSLPSDSALPAAKASPSAGRDYSPLPSPEITIIVGSGTNQTIQPLLGVNIGPAPAGTDPKNADLTKAYQQIGVRMVRTHDFYGPLDMSTLYPDRARDAENVESYRFQASDAKWRSIVNGGFEPYFRLGDSWNNARPPANPQERANWVRAAVEVVQHYREGKWDGFKTPFRYVEIWNEPDNRQFWQAPHSPLEYFQLYAETARALKQSFPDLRVGGPGLTQTGAITPQGKKWLHDFLVFIKQNNAPLDFFSWHLYANDPQEWANAAHFYRQELDSSGFLAVEMHVTEWNTSIRQMADKSPEALALRTGGKGAAILTAAWIVLQDNGIAVSTFYRGPDPDIAAVEFYGLFYADGKPKRSALAFGLWAQMADHPNRLQLTADPKTDLWMLAGKDQSGEIALLLANPGKSPYRYSLQGVGNRRVMLYQVNDASDQVQTREENASRMEIGGETVQLLIIRH